MLFAIDHGNSAVKTTNFVFTSGLAEYPAMKPPLQTDVLEGGEILGFFVNASPSCAIRPVMTGSSSSPSLPSPWAAEDGTTAAYAQRGAGGRSAARTLWHPAR